MVALVFMIIAIVGALVVAAYSIYRSVRVGDFTTLTDL